MQITRITKENGSYFVPYLPDEALEPYGDVIRLGILDDEKRVAGAMSVRVYDRFADIVSLYILPRYRRRGYGRALLEKIIDIIRSEGYEAVVAEFLREDAAVGFCNAMGFELSEGRMRYSFTFREFQRSLLFKRFVKDRKANGIQRVSSCNSIKRKILENQKGSKDYDPQWSTCNIRGDKVVSCLLAKRIGDSIMILSLDSDSSDRREVLYHIRALYDRIVEQFPEGNPVIRMYFQRDKVRQILYTLMSGKEHLHMESEYINAFRLI